MAITFEAHRKIQTTPKVRIGKKAYRLDVQIKKIEHIVKRYRSGEHSLNQCVAYGGSEYLEARGVLTHEIVEEEFPRAGGGTVTMRHLEYRLTNYPDVERCLNELLAMAKKLGAPIQHEIIPA